MPRAPLPFNFGILTSLLIVAMLSGLFKAVTALSVIPARASYREKLGKIQVAGVLVLLLGIALSFTFNCTVPFS